MKNANWLVMTFAAAVAGGSFLCLAEGPAAKKKVLMYSQSFGFRHSCVTRPMSGELSHAEKVFQKVMTEAGYEPFVSQDFKDLEGGGRFKQFDAIIFYTTGNPLIDRDGFLKWLRDGGAFIGIHCGTDTFHSDQGYAKGWPEYTEIVGGAFAGHGVNDKPVVMRVENSQHPAMRAIPEDWRIADEIYRFNRFSRDNVSVLMSIHTEKMDDETLKAHGMEKGKDYPVSWTNTEGKGRVFYTSLGHREDVWTNETWQKHLMGGLKWALGESK